MEFVNFLNSPHHSIQFTVEYSKKTVNFLDVQVVRQGNKIVTDLYTKPTDTHQLLHRSSCHPGHTKKGYSLWAGPSYSSSVQKTPFLKIY